MKEWIKNHKDTTQIIAAAVGALIGLTTAVLICGVGKATEVVPFAETIVEATS